MYQCKHDINGDILAIIVCQASLMGSVDMYICAKIRFVMLAMFDVGRWHGVCSAEVWNCQSMLHISNGVWNWNIPAKLDQCYSCWNPDPYVIRSSSPRVSAMENKWPPVFREDGYLLNSYSRCWKIIENANILPYFFTCNPKALWLWSSKSTYDMSNCKSTHPTKLFYLQI